MRGGAFAPLLCIHSENERERQKGRQQGRRFDMSRCNFRCFHPTELKDNRIMLPDTQTTVQSKVDISVATCEKSSRLDVIVNH